WGSVSHGKKCRYRGSYFEKFFICQKRILSMLEKQQSFTIIPAIDIIDGKCVRLVKGDYKQKTVYHEDPLHAAKQFEDAGLQRLHLVDLDGAKAGKVVNWKVLENISSHTNLI